MTFVGGVIASLLLPLLISAHLGYIALTPAGEAQIVRWFQSSVWFRFTNLLCVPLWWSFFEALDVSRSQANPILQTTFLVLPLSLTVLLARIVAFWSDTKIFGRGWTGYDIFKLAFWRTLSSTTALLLFAVSVDTLRNRSAFGIVLICCAGSLALIGTGLFRTAEGIRFRPVKSGELYKRAHVLAKRMGVHLQGVSVVPFGRGRLTNGYGGINQVALTDDYGHWLHGPELDFVIAHELSHCKQKHGVKKLLAATGLFVFSAGIAAYVPQGVFVTIVLNFCAIFVPMMASDALSRHFEYAADRGAVDLTGEAEAGVKSLTDMYRHTEVPAQSSRFHEMFSTHPVLSRRVQAIRRAGMNDMGARGASAR